ncbi:MAG: hypothetical protein ABIA78_04170 [archaeon]
MTEKISLEQRLKEQDKLAENILKSAFTQGVVGVNELKGNQAFYGTVGADNYYGSIMDSGEVSKVRESIQKEKNQEAKRLGINESPVVSNYDIIFKGVKQAREFSALLPLGKLEELTKEVAKNFKFNVPEKFKEVRIDIMAQKMAEGGEISEEEKDVYRCYEILNLAYTRGVAEKVRVSAIYSDLNSEGGKIEFKYKPKEEQEKIIEEMRKAA